jgi:hypothetical protein
MPSEHGFQTPDDRQRTRRLLLADYDRIDPAVRAVLAEFAAASALGDCAVRGLREELAWDLGDTDAAAALAVVRLVLAGADWTPWLAVAVTEAAATDPENVLALPGALRRASTVPARLADAPHDVWHYEERRHWGVH